MSVKRMDHAGVVVVDLAAAIAFFVEMGMELEGEATVEGEWADQLIGLDGVRTDIAMLKTPDGHSRVELSTFQRPVATSGAPWAPVNVRASRASPSSSTQSTRPSPACDPTAASSSVR